MKNQFTPGDSKVHSFKVTSDDFPEFDSKVVHPVCSTYVLAREIEWSTRKFVLEMLDPGEEGIGTSLSIEHNSPAFKEDEVVIEAKFESLMGNHLICSFTAKVGDRIVAMGRTGQKIFNKEKLEEIFSDFLK